MNFVENVKKQLDFNENGKELLMVIGAVIGGIIFMAILGDVIHRILGVFTRVLTASAIIPAVIIIAAFVVIYIANKVHLALGAFITVILLQILATSMLAL